jgi:cell division septation protein DedD
LASRGGAQYATIVVVTSDPGIRNLDQLQEREDERRTPHGVAATLLGLGGACLVFATLALGGRTSRTATPRLDPLGELVSRKTPATKSSADPSTELSPGDVTFPEMLSDQARPTTALAAVRPASPAASRGAATPTPMAEPPPPTDRLSVVPLPPKPAAPVPAQTLLDATPVVTRSRDALTRAATSAAQMTATSGGAGAGGVAPSGREGGYQLQVSSFRTLAEADTFADQLRARGHRAYVLEARVPGRGTWYRVRIGPFQTQHLAAQYRATFEEREHVVAFVVPPETTAKAY